MNCSQFISLSLSLPLSISLSLSIRVPNPSPVLDKDRAPMGPESYPVLGLGSWGRLLRGSQTPVLYWINFSLRRTAERKRKSASHFYHDTFPINALLLTESSIYTTNLYHDTAPISIAILLQFSTVLGVFQRPLTLILLQQYRNTNGSRIVIQIGGVYTDFCQEERILLPRYRDRNGRCIAIPFNSIGVRGPFDSPEYRITLLTFSLLISEDFRVFLCFLNDRSVFTPSDKMCPKYCDRCENQEKARHPH